MQLSQGQLNTFRYCPRRFQHTYLEQLSAPLAPAQQAAIAQGERFHLLMQQRELGLAIAPIPSPPAEEAQIYAAVERFLAAAPDLLRQEQVQFRQSEHRRSLPMQDFLLTVVYDLLILEPQRAEILDWKTYAQVPARETLQQNWQHKLYPFVLAETSDYSPEQITLSYWFVHPHLADADVPPTQLRFPYDAATHAHTRQELQQLLTNLTAALQDFAAGRSLPQIDAAKGRCPACPFAVRCQRLRTDTTTPTAWPPLDDIAEVSI